jgi:hypothetical protein
MTITSKFSMVSVLALLLASLAAFHGSTPFRARRRVAFPKVQLSHMARSIWDVRFNPGL